MKHSFLKKHGKGQLQNPDKFHAKWNTGALHEGNANNPKVKKSWLGHHLARKWLRIFRGRVQPSKGVSSPALDLYPIPLCRVKKGKRKEQAETKEKKQHQNHRQTDATESAEPIKQKWK